MGLDVSGQADWGGGMYRGRKAPENSFYDAVNALINDEGFPFRRGGNAYKNGANAGTTLLGLASFAFPIATASSFAGYFHTLFWSSTKVYALQYSNDSTNVDITPTEVPRALARGVGIGAVWYVPTAATGANQLMKAVVGTTNPTASNQTVPSNEAKYVAAVGTPARLIVTHDNRAYFSDAGDATTIGSNNYHELPQAAEILGADGIGDTCILFTSAGVYAISNMSLDPVDAAGNVQHQVDQLNDLIIWGDGGVARFSGGLVVPGIDDVYLFSLGSPPQPITEGIRPLYQGYVKSGYQPGIGAVHRGHYFLPVVNGTSWVDTLVCRLDRGNAWTRWSGHSASIAFAQRIGRAPRSPKLLGLAAQRVTDLTSTLDPTASNAQDADATNFDCVITTRDFPTSATNHPGTAVKARLRYELVDDGNGGTAAPTLALAYSSDQDAGSFTTLSNPILESAGTAGGGVSDGSKYSAWPVGKMRERIRYRITMSGAAGSFVLRSLEQLVRQGRLR